MDPPYDDCFNPSAAGVEGRASKLYEASSRSRDLELLPFAIAVTLLFFFFRLFPLLLESWSLFSLFVSLC